MRHPAAPVSGLSGRAVLRLTLVASALSLAGCSSLNDLLAGDKVDYRSAAVKTQPLEVPPDLTQLARETRYQPQSGTVSAAATTTATAVTPASAAPNAPAAATGTPAVAPAAVGELRIERAGGQRWLFVPVPAEQLWPQLRAFWQERGFNLVTENAESGVMETDWAENRAKLPDDILRRTLGRLVETLYSTGERDRFRTRVERVPGGTEVYISHRGLEEVYSSASRDSTVWQPRAADPQLEAEFLSRLMVRLGQREEAARTTVAAAPEAPARARALPGQPAASLEVDEGFDRAWRRVGLALDRSGFTVEDRDRAGGLYFVRYVDPKAAAPKEPGFLGRLFGRGSGDAAASAPARYRIAVKGDGAKSVVSVLNAGGSPENGDTGRRIVDLLVAELR